MHTQQISEEFAYALGSIRSYMGEANTIVEIGTDYGGSLILLSLLAADDAQMVSIDPNPLSQGKFDALVRPTINMTQLLGGSEDDSIYNDLITILDGRGIDILFIDSVKDAPAPRDNFETYSKLVNSPGVVMFHEIERPGVRDIWDEVSINYPHDAIHTRLNRLKSWYGLGMIYF